MVKSRAEIQKEYRERKKKEMGERYLDKERQRVKSYYVPSQDLSRHEKEKRNIKKRECMRRTRERRKATQNENHTPLLVKMTFGGKGSGGKGRVRNTIKKQRQAIRTLTTEKENIKRKYNALVKKVYRMNSSKTKPNLLLSSPQTPKRRADADLLKEGIDPKRMPKVRRKLVNAYALMAEIKEATNERHQTAKNDIESIVAGKILKKYRSIKNISEETGVNRHRISKMKSKLEVLKKRKRNEIRRNLLIAKVEEFLTRDDNSRVVPDKQGVKKNVDGTFKAKRTLLDNLENLHQKFCMENTDVKISRASFFRYRPKHILPASFTARNTCLCTKHQNIALKLKVVKNHTGLKVTSNVDKFFTDYTDDQIKDALAEIESGKLTFLTWKRVEDGEGKKRMKIVEENKSKEEFKDIFMADCKLVRSHISLVHNQYTEIRRLKENLAQDEMVVQMDFSENYTCSNQSEIQSAYWNPTMVTLHPVVAYYSVAVSKDGETRTELQHQSFVYVSDELSHTCVAVYSFMRDLVPRLKMINPELSCIHYITDSPTSQYRNKTIFHIVSQHKEEFGVKASWQYFEAGHGKGPCDGIGAVAKRMADNAVKQGKVTIQDANDFFSWAKDTQSSVKYIFVSKKTCENVQNEVKDIKVKPVKGTIKLHAVFGLDNLNEIATSVKSCFCPDCYSDGMFKGGCDGWEQHILSVEDITTNEQDLEELGGRQEPAEDDMEPSKFDISPEKWVAANYEGKWYIGKILEVDLPDSDILVTFMEKCNNCKDPCKYRWPQSEDEVWVKINDVICNIQEPTPQGKTKRIFAISSDDFTLIQDCLLER